MGKRSVSVGILTALVAGFIAILAPAANALTSVESCFYHDMNSARAANGRRALTLMSDLTAIARKHSQQMAHDGTIYHNQNLGNDIQGNWTAAGENVGMGPDCQSIHDAFMASPGHRANILDTDYNQVGVGVAYDSSGTVYVTEDFAGRTSSSTTTTTHRTTTTYHSVTHQATTFTHHTAAAAKPAPRPLPKPKTLAAAAVPSMVPQTVSVLMKLVGLDARQVDPATGAAMGV